MLIRTLDDFMLDKYTLDRFTLDNFTLDGAKKKSGIPLSTLNVGDKVKFGKIYSEPIIWEVADKNHTGYPTDSVTLVSERIIKIMAFDAKEPLNSNSDRQKYGNNRYLHSNIRQWLNSAAADGAWYSAQHTADAPPNSGAVTYNPYTLLAGFLNAFTANELDAILDTTLTVAKTSTDGGGSETVTDKVFLLSNTEVGLANENNVTEGLLLTLFSGDASRTYHPTVAAVSSSDYKNSVTLSASQAWHWWLRTPRFGYSISVRRVDTDGSLIADDAYLGLSGICPACNLSDTTAISATVDGDGCYTVI